MTIDTLDVVAVAGKRAFDSVPVQWDWHDHLIRVREPGARYDDGACVRLPRQESTGLEYVAIGAGGVTSRRPPVWPVVTGQETVDGSVRWRARPVSPASLRATITDSQVLVSTGLTVDARFDEDSIYTALVSGGVSGSTYNVTHRVTLDTGEKKELVAVLGVDDATGS